VQKIGLIAALTIGLLTIPFLAHAEVYRWIDDKGDVHFTDDYSKIPEKYRPVAETRRFPQDPKDTSPSSVEQKPSPAPASIQRTEEEKIDTHGRGEEYWRETVRPWKEQLKQAQEDYKNTNYKIDDTLEVVKGKFLSKTQYNFKRQELERLMEEREIYEARIKEANKMLANIGKKAEEAKANPEWLK
jgi:hypothetical protein